MNSNAGEAPSSLVQSGIFPTRTERSTANARVIRTHSNVPPLEDIARAFRRHASGRIGVVLTNAAGQKLRATLLDEHDRFLEPGHELPMLMAEWLEEIRGTSVVATGDKLRPWFCAGFVLAIPIRSPVWLAGAVAISVENSLPHSTRLLEDLAADFALQLEAGDRQHRARSFVSS